MMRDFRIAIRTLRSWRWGAALAVLTLALGIGTTTALYALLRVALADSAVDIEDVDRVVRIYGVNPPLGARRSPVTFDDFEVLQSRVGSFEGVAAYQGVEMTVGPGGEDDVVNAMLVSGRFFDVLRGRPKEGRLFTPADRSDDAPAAVVSELTWRRRFAGRGIDESPVIRLNGRDYTVVGVLPASFSYPMIGIAADVWIPLARRGSERVGIVSRLAPGISWTSAAAELDALAPPNQPEAGWRWGGIPVAQDVSARTGGATAWILLPAAVVLVIGCVNVACMLLARGIRRDTELSVRMALGASRGAIVRQLLLENGLLGLVAGVLGTALAFWALDVVVRTVIEAKPEAAAKLSGDPGLMPIALTSSIVAAALFGLVPAFRLSRRDVASSLKGSAPPPRVRIAGYSARDLVVFVELTLASVLVVMMAMSFAIFSVVQDTEFGFAVNELFDIRIPARDADAATDRVRAIGGVTRVSTASGGPGGGLKAMASTPGGRTSAVSVLDVDTAFFETAGLPIVRGRQILPDETGGAAVAVVSEQAAASLWPGDDPIGKPLDLAVRGRSTRSIVIGVAREAIQMALPRPEPGHVYRPLDASAHAQLTLVARASRPAEAARAVRTALSRDARAPVHVNVLTDGTREFTQAFRVLRLFGGFALIALLLAGSGIFAVVSQSVTQRTPEFGVRLALGATPWRILRTVLGRELKLIVAALATGTVGTIAMTRSSGFDDAAMIVAVNMSRPEWGIGLIGLCGVVAASACLLATYRIVKLEPSAVLRRL